MSLDQFFAGNPLVKFLELFGARNYPKYAIILKFANILHNSAHFSMEMSYFKLKMMQCYLHMHTPENIEINFWDQS